MQLVGTAGQKNGAQYLFDASVTIGATSTPQLVLPKANQRSSLILENLSGIDMYVEIGAARATAGISNAGAKGAVTSVSVTNTGFGYSLPPKVIFFGGAYINSNQITPTYSTAGLPDYAAPGHPAQAHCVMSGAAGSQTVNSIVIDDGGQGYAYPPFVFLLNDPNDPFGAATPASSIGIRLVANGGNYVANGSFCTTDQISVISAASGGILTCKFSL